MSENFRKKLSKEIMDSPKADRKGVLDTAKSNPEYWQSRTSKIKERQNEEQTDDGLGIFVKNKTLYHGSGTKGINKLNVAEEDTVGGGIYFTSEAKDAIGYARVRSKTMTDRNEESQPVIYEASVENMKLLDLRKTENVKKILDSFKSKLKQLRENAHWPLQGAIDKAIEAINSGKVGTGNLKEVVFSFGSEFSQHAQSLGYEGLITYEGGEGGNGEHDSYVIFNPAKVKINQEHKII